MAAGDPRDRWAENQHALFKLRADFRRERVVVGTNDLLLAGLDEETIKQLVKEGKIGPAAKPPVTPAPPSGIVPPGPTPGVGCGPVFPVKTPGYTVYAGGPVAAGATQTFATVQVVDPCRLRHVFLTLRGTTVAGAVADVRIFASTTPALLDDVNEPGTEIDLGAARGFQFKHLAVPIVPVWWDIFPEQLFPAGPVFLKIVARETGGAVGFDVHAHFDVEPDLTAQIVASCAHFAPAFRGLPAAVLLAPGLAGAVVPGPYVPPPLPPIPPMTPWVMPPAVPGWTGWNVNGYGYTYPRPEGMG